MNTCYLTYLIFLGAAAHLPEDSVTRAGLSRRLPARCARPMRRPADV